MRALVFAVLILCPTLSWASVEFTGEACVASFDSGDLLHYANYRQGALTCETLTGVSTGLQAVSLTLTAGSLYAACTGIGAPYSLLMQGGALSFRVVDLVVKQLPCDSKTQDEKIQRMTNQAVCEKLKSQGIVCNL